MYDSLSAISLRDEGVPWFYFILLYFAIGEGRVGVMDKVSMAGLISPNKASQKNKEKRIRLGTRYVFPCRRQI